jgi:hypothetical protein
VHVARGVVLPSAHSGSSTACLITDCSSLFFHLQMAIENSRSRSDARVSVLAVLALGSVSTLIAFVTPNWLASDTRLYGAEFLKLGLWETCFRSFRGVDDTDFRKYFAGCRWIFREEYQSIRSFLMPGQFSLMMLMLMPMIPKSQRQDCSLILSLLSLSTLSRAWHNGCD